MRISQTSQPSFTWKHDETHSTTILSQMTGGSTLTTNEEEETIRVLVTKGKEMLLPAFRAREAITSYSGTRSYAASFEATG